MTTPPTGGASRAVPARPVTAIALIALFLLTAVFAPTRSDAVIIQFANFSNISGQIQLNGHAAVANTSDGAVLRLVPATTNRAGTAYGLNKISATTFSTAFEFRVTGPGGISDGTESGADGFTFIIQNHGLNSVGSTGLGLGIAGINPSLAIEFDTFQNSSDPSSNHVGIDLNGSTGSVASANVSQRFDNGTKYTAWIDYNGETLEVRISSNGVRPTNALLSHSLTLSSALNASSAYVGFTASTGAAYGNYDIISWTYSDTFVAGGVSVPNAIPEPGTTALIALGLGALFVSRRRRKASR